MKVKFVPQDIEVEIKPNQTVLQLAQDNDLHIKSVCKGIPSCAECRVNIKEGEYNVMPPSQTELNLIGTAYFVDHRRLSCQLRCFGDVTIDLTEQVAKENEVVNSKRPRGYVHKKEGEESAAVMGNVLDEVDHQSQADVNERTANINLEVEETRRELERIRSKKRGSRKSNSKPQGHKQEGIDQRSSTPVKESADESRVPPSSERDKKGESQRGGSRHSRRRRSGKKSGKA